METKQAHIILLGADKNDFVETLWSVPTKKEGYVEIRDEYWSATFGACQEVLSQVAAPARLIVDFSKVCWADPLPLLSIIVAVKNCSARTKSEIVVRLGSEPDSASRQIRGGFLRFIHEHGFMSTLSGMPTTIEYGKNTYVPQDEKLADKLTSEMNVMAYPDSLCLDAVVKPVSAFQGEEEVSRIISGWVGELKKSNIKGIFEGESELLDELIDTVDILLNEIVLNAGEHAYDENNNMCHVGLYIRLRKLDQNKTKSWLQKHGYVTDEQTCCPGLINFDLSSNYSTWLEVYYLDLGRGLLADFEMWKQKATGALKKKISRIKPPTNMLHESAKLLFQETLSRHDRVGERTVLTGLQYVRHALADDENGARVYSAGEWVCARLPWSRHLPGGAINLGKQKRFCTHDGRPRFSSGTAWHFCLNLDYVLARKDGHKMPEWEQITNKDIGSFGDDQAQTTYDDWDVFDDFVLKDGMVRGQWHKEVFSKKFSLWIPAFVRKNVVLQWHTAINKREHDNKKPWVWLIAGLTRKDALLLDAVLKHEQYKGKRNNVLIYIMTRDWHLKCLSSITGKDEGDAYKYDKRQTKLAKIHRGAFIFNMLREHDSRIFWRGMLGEEPDSAFICERVVWDRYSDNKPRVELCGYLDLTHALLEPQRAAVARRALERVWYLHANNADCYAADRLLTNLLPREARLSLAELQKSHVRPERKLIVVGSVYVTGSTTERAIEAGRTAIHLLQHTQVDGVCGKSLDSSRVALNWIDKKITISDTPSNTLSYERIPGTPYISRGGAKAAPIRRFSDSDFVGSLYKKDPQETYNEFTRYGLLKLGHWVYETHHDLLTVNLGDCVEKRRHYKNNAVEWVLDELTRLADDQFVESTSKFIVVYVSHPSTEKIVRAVKKNAELRGKELPLFIPVHFLAKHTQTAIRIPSLTYDRIRSKLEESKKVANIGPSIVLLDDGAVTGKVQREMEQLLRNAGATKVIHVGLVTRTGLPLYRKYHLETYGETHRYYWRWDVPPLGKAITCPLCRAIDQARELSSRLWNEEAKKEVGKWVDNWEERQVTTHWSRHGLDPASLPDDRVITFGKEWEAGRSQPKKYPLKHTTTTGLAATVMEIMRTTSYKEVGLKLARSPWGDEYQGDKNKWREAKLEILVCQLLLYFDDFEEDEVQERFRLLLEVMLAPTTDVSEYDKSRRLALDRLGCLVLLLAKERHCEFITRHIWKLFNNVDELNIHLLTVIGILINRVKAYPDQLKKIKESGLNASQKIKIEHLLAQAFFNGRGEEVRGTTHAVFSLVLLLGENDMNAHTGFFRKKLCCSVAPNKQSIIRDLSTLAQSLGDINNHILTDHADSPSFNPEEEIREVERLHSADVKDSDWLYLIRDYLFDGNLSLSTKFRNTFLMSAIQVSELLRTSINSNNWNIILNCCKEETRNRWTRDGQVIMPNIEVIIDGIPDNTLFVIPPIARKMVRDYIFNVVHSASKIVNFIDMVVTLNVIDNILRIKMSNRTENEHLPRPKPADGIVSDHLLSCNPVHVDNSNGIITVTINLPTVEFMWEKNQ